MLLFDTRALLVGAFNQRRGTNHTVDDVEFGIPFANTELPVGTATIDNTCIRVRANGIEETFTYRRLGLLEPMQQFTPNTLAPLKLKMGDGTFTSSIAKSFEGHFGYPLHPDDVLEDGTAISDNSLSIRIANRSIQWLPGTYTFTLDSSYIRVGNNAALVYTPTRVEPEWWYESRVDVSTIPDSRPRLDVLTYGNDYSPVWKHLLRLKGKANPGSTSYHYNNKERLARLAKALSGVDGLPWSGDNNAPVVGGKFNIYDVWCSYNGPTKDINPALHVNKRNVPAVQLPNLKPIDTRYERVCILRPFSASAAMASNGFSPDTMLLHYNIKE